MSDLMYRHRRGALALVVAPACDPVPLTTFCTHCGARPEHEEHSRVCERCSFGVLLQAAVDVAPDPGQAFIVLDGSLSVCAVSAGAEQLLAISEPDAIHQHVGELLVSADAEAQNAPKLAEAIAWAVRGEEGPARVAVRPTNTFGVRLSATIAACGPPQAALVVLNTTLKR